MPRACSCGLLLDLDHLGELCAGCAVALAEDIESEIGNAAHGGPTCQCCLPEIAKMPNGSIHEASGAYVME